MLQEGHKNYAVMIYQANSDQMMSEYDFISYDLCKLISLKRNISCKQAQGQN